MAKLQLGVIGLGTMGANLARNAARNNAKVAVYNRTTEKMEAFVEKFSGEGNFVACKTLNELKEALSPPRAILIMVKAGDAVDKVIESLIPLLDKGDILIDGGNSHFTDTLKRESLLNEHGMHFIGMGVSGGEEGALNGPSMMPGGNKDAWEAMQELLTTMAADDGAGGKCVSYIGPGGAGHFVKMVHNGIEYGIMQLIAESYDILKSIGGLSNDDLAKTFDAWKQTDALNSFLVEITADIFKKKDDDTGGDLLDVIKDTAKQKGTGKWTTETAMTYGLSTPTINAAVDARIISGSSKRNNKRNLAEALDGSVAASKDITTAVRDALELSIICTYNQGFRLIENIGKEERWDLTMSEVVRIWRGGCIIRSKLLEKFQAAYDESNKKASEEASKEIMQRFEGDRQESWRHVIALAVGNGIPTPCLSASLHYYDALRREHLPQNLVQAQRDNFGAHTFERIDKEGVFHVEW